MASTAAITARPAYHAKRGCRGSRGIARDCRTDIRRRGIAVTRRLPSPRFSATRVPFISPSMHTLCLYPIGAYAVSVPDRPLTSSITRGKYSCRKPRLSIANPGKRPRGCGGCDRRSRPRRRKRSSTLESGPVRTPTGRRDSATAQGATATISADDTPLEVRHSASSRAPEGLLTARYRIRPLASMDVSARLADLRQLSHAARADCCSGVGPSVAHADNVKTASVTSGAAIQRRAAGVTRPSFPRRGRVCKRLG
jgi:hypothetical protein